MLERSDDVVEPADCSAGAALRERPRRRIAAQMERAALEPFAELASER